MKLGTRTAVLNQLQHGNGILKLAIVFILTSGFTFAQKPIVQDSALSELSTEIGNLVHLIWDGDRLVIDRNHWIASTGEKTDAEREEAQIKAMIDRGIPEKIARRMAERGRPGRAGGGFGGFGGLTATPEGQLFEELKIAAGAMSGGGGGGDDERHWNGRGSNIYMLMNTKNSTKGFRLMIRESQAPYQEFTVEQHHDKGLRIQFSSQARNLVFAQSIDGEIQVAATSKNRNDAFRVATYEEMLDKHPDFAADFGAILDSLGINRPLSNYDPRVVQMIGEMVAKPDDNTLDAARKAIEQLGAESFQVRENAEKLVTENVTAWRSVIREKLAASDLNTEIRIRLESVIAASASESQSSEAEALIEDRKLLSNAEYLRSILNEVPASLQTSIRQHLDDLEK